MGELQLYGITNLALGEWPSVITDARSRPCSMASAGRRAPDAGKVRARKDGGARRQCPLLPVHLLALSFTGFDPQRSSTVILPARQPSAAR